MTRPLDIAIVGLAGCYAGARDARAFWQNILDKVDAVADASPEWTGPYFEPNTTANDRTYTTKGGFLRELAEVNPMEFGVLPSIAEGGDPDHLMALKHVRDALLDAGYLGGKQTFDPERAGVVIGRGTYGNRAMACVLSRGLFLDQAMELARSLRPDLSAADLAELRQHFRGQLPPYNADMVGPTTPNVIAGLIANRLNLMGPNYIVDAASASTLFALDAAVRELISGRCDLMLAGGVQSHKAESADNAVPALQVGETVIVTAADLVRRKTDPPKRYTEADLVKALESEGIGRPSTYAAIMEKIGGYGYVEQQKIGKRDVLLPTKSACGLLSKALSLSCGSLASTPSWNFIHSRGTERNKVGRARRRSAENVASDSLKKTWKPWRRELAKTTAPSNTCASGR